MINIKEFKNMVFESHGIIEFQEKEFFKVPAGWEPTDKKAEFRERLRDTMYEKNDIYRLEKDVNTGDFPLVEIRCSIPVDSIKKIMSGRYKVSREILAKFAVGMELDLAEANDLFELHSFPLNEKNDFDFVLIHALESKDSVYEFMDEVYKLLGIKLDKDM